MDSAARHGLDDSVPNLSVVFQEFAEILKADSTTDVAKLKPASAAARDFASHLSDARSATEALFLVCHSESTQFGAHLFGSASIAYDANADQLTVTGGDKRLQVLLALQGKRDRSAAEIVPSAVVLETDFQHFSLTRSDGSGRLSQPFAVFDGQEVADDIGLTGSLWDIVFPTHYAIVSRTISYAFPKRTEGALFSQPVPHVDDMQAERAAFDQLACLDTLSTRLLTLQGLTRAMRKSSKSPMMLSEQREGSYTLRRYAPQRSALFDFGEAAGTMTRGDFVTTYNVGDHEFHREFVVLPNDLHDEEKELLSATFDLLYILSIRRTKLFRAAFARRVYNVLLPAVILHGQDDNGGGYAIFPCMNLYRTPRRGFRRTLSLTFLACPVDVIMKGDVVTDLRARPASLDELYKIKNALLTQVVRAGSEHAARYLVSGPGRDYFNLPVNCSIDELLHKASTIVLERILSPHREDPSARAIITETLFAANQESRLATMMLLVDWKPPSGFTQPWERWLTTGEDRVFRNALFRTLFYADYLDPGSADVSRHAIEFGRFNIGNSEGADIGGMTLYNPHESLKVVLYPRSRERYPDYSIVRWMVWQIYIDSALTALRALIFKFHPILEDRGYLHSLIYALDEMVQEFIDFYELDLRDLLYRQEYEKIRTLMQIDADYTQLMNKFNAAKVDESLREQRLINKLVVSLTVATVTITVLSTLAQVGALTVPWYLAVSLPVSGALVLVGYHAFDPARLVYARVARAISRLWQ